MRQLSTFFVITALISGCAQLQWPGTLRTSPDDVAVSDPAEVAPPDQGVAPVPPAARTVEQFDTTTEEQKAAAASAGASGGGQDLGLTVTSLGAPSEPGFWLKTPLVSAPAKGRVTYPGTGKSAQVDLIPIDGPKTAGSRMSLSAMRLIGAPFTGLPEIRVYRVEG
ncbi:hypothetical protein AAFO92_03960 [Roseovarius sp. CAU 1744]|uniref:hypothetical protein n=1 Tax=Roseovarius sp. CAU 1744 TaxID=3140368 RepID=UPI00325B7EB1